MGLFNRSILVATIQHFVDPFPPQAELALAVPIVNELIYVTVIDSRLYICFPSTPIFIKYFYLFIWMFGASLLHLSCAAIKYN